MSFISSSGVCMLKSLSPCLPKCLLFVCFIYQTVNLVVQQKQIKTKNSYCISDLHAAPLQISIRVQARSCDCFNGLDRYTV
jgi:hypothetical protein